MWCKTKYTGVRYRESTKRKIRVKGKTRPERCLYIQFRVGGGKLQAEKIGWESEGLTPERARDVRGEILANIRLGSGPQSLKEKRGIEEVRRELHEADRLADDKENTPFDVLAQKYLDWARENKKSWKDDVSRYGHHIKPVIGHVPIKGISVFTLEDLKRKLKRKKKLSPKNIPNPQQLAKLSEATIKHCLVLVRQMFNRGIGWNLFHGENPVRETIRIDKKFLKTSDNKRLRFLTRAEAKNLLNELMMVSMQTHDICLISLQTGMRMGEIFALVWRDVALESDLIYIKNPKNNESRTAYITPQINKMFKDRMKKVSNKGALVFGDANGKRLTQLSETFMRAVNKLKLNKGVEDRQNKIVPHSLRHTFASWLAQQGETLLTIKELMGHKDIETTMRYAHLVPDQKRKAVLKLAKNGGEN